MTSGFVLRTRTDALSNPRVRTAGVRAAYGTVRADEPEVVGSAGSRNNPLHMVSWIYSELYILEIWTGVTLIQQNGPNALKMVLVSRIQKYWASVFI